VFVFSVHRALLPWLWGIESDAPFGARPNRGCVQNERFNDALVAHFARSFDLAKVHYGSKKGVFALECTANNLLVYRVFGHCFRRREKCSMASVFVACSSLTRSLGISFKTFRG
jgi:hypothetical protein